MARRLEILLAAVLLLLGVAAIPGGASPADDSVGDGIAEVRNRFVHLTTPASIGADHGSSADRRAPRSRNLSAVGANDFGGQGFNADVWALGDHAYVGRWGFWIGGPDFFCPATGTSVVNISDPANPNWIGTIPTEPGTNTNDVKTARVNTRYFRGDVLAVSNEDCANVDTSVSPPLNGARGFELWDISDPASPSQLGRWGPAMSQDTCADASQYGFGVHNLFIFEQGRRAYVAAVLDFAEIIQVLCGVSGPGDLVIVDITDPADPQTVASFGAVNDLGLDPLGTEANVFLHDIWVENDIAYLSYWDAGLILLDVSDPTNPRFISRTDYWPEEEGDTHVAVPAHGGNLVITGDEDFSSDPWGFMRVFDTQDQAAPVQVGTYDTGNLATPSTEGDFTIHNVIVRGNTVYASWYSDGIQLVDISQPASPRGIGSFVPAGVPDPFGVLPEFPEMWGVYVQRDLILGSDMNAGLYVLKAKL